MKQLLKDNRIFWIPYLFIVAIVTPFLIIYSKANIHLYLNQFYSAFFDFIFKYITYLGDGAVVGIIGLLILLFYHIRGAIFILLSYSVSGILAQFFKRFFFNDTARPSKFFEGIADLHVVEGVKLYAYRSFPSGHSTTGFALFFVLALMVKNNGLKIFFLIMALLVAYSRVYLSQHFVIDIVAGSALGIVTSLLLYYYINPAIERQSWSEKSLITILKPA